MDKTPAIGGYIRDAKSDRYGIITQLTDDGGFFARPAELPYTADAAGIVPGAPDGAKIITATHWSPVGNGRWSGIWADAPLNAWTEVYLVNPVAAALGSIRTPKKAASSRANGAKGGRPRLAPWTVAEVRAVRAEFSTACDGGTITARLLDAPDDEPAAFDVSASWGEIGPLDNVDADLDSLAWDISRALPSSGGWAYDPQNGIIVQANS